jgi:hypothetical protein
MEAMACGLPVIAANSYALPELVHQEQNGFLFQPGNSDELAHYLDLLLSDAELRKRMGAESLKIIAKHDRVKILDQWEELYRRLALEFLEEKERRQHMRIARKYPGYAAQPPQRSRIRRTGDLAFDQTRSK